MTQIEQARHSDAKDDFFDFADDDEIGSTSTECATAPWRILIVDDEKDVHSATLYALSGLTIVGRRLEFFHAYSAVEAQQLLKTTSRISVLLLDVVMESSDSGLSLVRYLREDLGCTDTRIILRTGQPGYAPELEVIRDYDINDYKTKSELTRTKLVTALTTAIRSYEQLRIVIEGRRKLDHIVRLSPSLFARRDLEEYASGVLQLAGSLLGFEADGVFCVPRAYGAIGLEGVDGEEREKNFVVGAYGRHTSETGKTLEDVADPKIAKLLCRCCDEKVNVFQPEGFALYFHNDVDCLAVLCMETPYLLNDTDRRLLEVLCVGITVGLENVTLFQKLNSLAYFDPLCRLPNRQHFVSLIDKQLKQDRHGWAIALIDVDHFSDVNAALGHRTGDQLLVAMAGRLREGFPPEVTVARVSGGTFGLLGRDELLEPEKILALFAYPILVADQSLMLQPLIGLERLAESEGRGTDVFKNANIALSRAKSDNAGRWKYFTRDMQLATQQRLGMLHELRHAAEAKRGLSLYYQPLIEASTKRVIGAEALMRWTNDRGEEISPTRFIPLAEYSHLIIELGEWALRGACKQLKIWQAAGFNDMRMSVNVSLAQFRDPNFVSLACRCVEESGVDPTFIELELTESLALQETVTVVEALHELKAFGFSIAIDDFGSGFSSLNHLLLLPINRLKIDRAFVADLSEARSSSSIADMIVKLSNMLGLSVIAEGVETAYQYDVLLNMGCTELQGFYFSPPLPADKFEAYLRKNQG